MVDLPVSRRGLVRVATAALGAVSMPAATMALANVLPAPATPDAVLMALIVRHDDATDEAERLANVSEDLSDRWRMERPDRPVALDARHYEGLGACPTKGIRSDGRIGPTYGADEVEQIRATPATRTYNGSDTPCPRLIARRAEVISAYDTWKAGCDAVADRLGVPKAEARAFEAQRVVEGIETDIMAFEPRTLADVVAKAKWVDNQEPADGWPEQIVADLCALNLTT